VLVGDGVFVGNGVFVAVAVFVGIGVLEGVGVGPSATFTTNCGALVVSRLFNTRRLLSGLVSARLNWPSPEMWLVTSISTQLPAVMLPELLSKLPMVGAVL
jgi:hypothetical protein